MAVIDFSNATLTWVGSSNAGDIALASVWNDLANTFTASAGSHTSIVASETRSRNNISTTHVTVICTGTTTTSGNKMVLHNRNWDGTEYGYWEISNISFEENDIFSFVVDLNFTT